MVGPLQYSNSSQHQVFDCCHTKNRGFTLVELLIAIVVTAVGVMGAVATHATIKKNTLDSNQRTKAVFLANDMLERIRLNKTQIAGYTSVKYGNGNFAAPDDPSNCNSAANCNSGDILVFDQIAWDNLLKGKNVTNTTIVSGEDDITNNIGGLLNPIGCIGNDNGLVTVTVTWFDKGGLSYTQDNSSSTCDDSDSKRRYVSLSSHIY